MISTRIVIFAVLACVLPVLASCVTQTESVDRQIERELAEFHASCLSPTRPAYSVEHTDCVLTRYQARQRQIERLRNAVAPPPPPAPATPEQTQNRTDWVN
jgi:hypothetical protein